MRFTVQAGALAVVMAQWLALAQPPPPNTAAWSADLARYYFKTPAEEIAARDELNAALDRTTRLKGHLENASQLLELMRSYYAAQELFAKHDAYLHLRCAMDRNDRACHDRQQLSADVTAKTAFVESEILSLSDDRLRAFLNKAPALRQYGFAIASVRRAAPHLLPAGEQALLDQFDPEIAGWQNDLYEQVIAQAAFGAVPSPAGSLDVVRQRNLILRNADRRVREEGFKKRYAGFASQRDLIALALLNTVRAQDRLAKVHRYADAPTRKYEDLWLDPAETRSLLSLMAQHGDVVKRYEKIRSQDFQRASHQAAQAWDMLAPPTLTPALIPLPEVRRILHDAFAGLGEEYQAAFDALLDPTSGRADILPNGAANRYSSGFSVGFTGSTSILFYGRYDGTFKDVSVIAHEGGHATHRQLMNSNGVPPSYARGPNFLFESFAEFNELLLADFMAERATEPGLRRYYREQWMEIKGLDAFYGAQDALLEQEIYDGVSAGTIHNADDLDSVSLKIDGQFSSFPVITPELRSRWETVSLMFEDPLYDVNYMYGGLLALKYYQLYSSRREWFVPRYLALLKHGFDQPPAELLKRFLEVDLSGSGLLKDDLELLQRRFDQLEVSAISDR